MDLGSSPLANAILDDAEPARMEPDHRIDPAVESKVIRCARGAASDVLLHLRPNSPNYPVAFELDNRCEQALFAPICVAHGLQTLRDDSSVYRQMGAP